MSGLAWHSRASIADPRGRIGPVTEADNSLDSNLEQVTSAKYFGRALGAVPNVPTPVGPNRHPVLAGRSRNVIYSAHGPMAAEAFLPMIAAKGKDVIDAPRQSPEYSAG